MSETYGPSSCPSGLALESKLSRSQEAHSGFMLKLSHHSWKNPGSCEPEKHDMSKPNTSIQGIYILCFSAEAVPQGSDILCFSAERSGAGFFL